MKNLFKLISALLIAYCTFCFVNSVSSQNTDAIRAAFSNSYTYENKTDYTKAIEELKKVYKDDSYEINVRLGWLNYMSELFKESITYYQKAIKLMPLSIEAKLGYVLPQSSNGKWDVVKDIYEEILQTDPMNSTVNYRMGMIYYGKQDYNNAYKYIENLNFQFSDQTMMENGTKTEAKEKVFAELHEILTGTKLGRENADEITLYDSVGIALEDYSALRFTYELSNRYKLGEELNFTPALKNSKNLISVLK